MARTPRFGFPYEGPDDHRPGWSITGERDGIPLAEAVEERLAWLDSSTGEGYRRTDTTVYFTANGNFVKGDYPGLRAVMVRMVGGGGAGGPAVATVATGTDTTVSCGGGGGSGAYAQRFILVDDLPASATVVVGAGGVNTGGGQSSFDGATVFANGGERGAASTATTGNVGVTNAAGGAGGFTLSSPPFLFIRGTGGAQGIAWRSPAAACLMGEGASSLMSGRPATAMSGSVVANGVAYGGGGSGAFNAPGTAAKNGGNGAAGLVAVDLYM